MSVSTNALSNALNRALTNVTEITYQVSGYSRLLKRDAGTDNWRLYAKTATNGLIELDRIPAHVIIKDILADYAVNGSIRWYGHALGVKVNNVTVKNTTTRIDIARKKIRTPLIKSESEVQNDRPSNRKASNRTSSSTKASKSAKQSKS